MSLLLVDISNSFIKYAIASDGRVAGAVERMPTSQLLRGDASELQQACQGRHVFASSVVPDASHQLQQIVAMLGGRLDLLDAGSVRGLTIDYPAPATIGPDRLANALGALAVVAAPCVVVDFGTAVTFDIINRESAYVGGIIAPGIAAMTDYLHEHTALLPRIVPREPVEGFIGKSTEEAMQIGVVHGYRGMVAALLDGLANEFDLNRELEVIATGGYAELIAGRIPQIQRVDPNLTLSGLLRFAMLVTSEPVS